jgi:hypothetical protein
MDPGEQTTGTRDEHYNLISVLYHALHGVENCNAYTLDAEAAGDERLAAFFREAEVRQARLAEQAKGLLGIGQEEAPPGLEEDGPDEEGPLVEGVSPTTDVPRTSPGEDLLPPGDVASGAPQVAMSRISSEDFDPTISALQGGVENLALERALGEIDGWEQRLEESGDPELVPIAENLRQLRVLLTAGSIDRVAVGKLLNTLGEQVQGVASGGLGASIAEKLQVLGGILNTEGRAVSS